ncbi:hypothetical protein COBT_000733 [Conglomerata obtusa]
MNENISVTSGVFCLCKAILGSSLVTLPYVYKELGIITATLLIIFFMIINVFTLLFLTDSAKKKSCKSLIELGKYILKQHGEMTITVFLFLSCVVPLIFYIKITTDYIHVVLLVFGFNCNIEYVRILTALICAYMCSIFRNIEQLKHTSIIGLVSLFLLTLYTISLFFYDLNSIVWENVKLSNISFNSLDAISLICFAFNSQFSIIPITNSINTKKEYSKVIWISNIISALIFITTGLFGYLVQQNTTSNFLHVLESNVFTIGLKIALGIVNFMTYPLLMLPTRTSLEFIVDKCTKFEKSMIKDFSLVVFLILLSYSCSFIYEIEENFLVNLFFVTGSFVMFALPSYIYAKIFKKEFKKFRAVIILICAGLTIFGVCKGIYGFLEIFISNYQLQKIYDDY